MTKFNNILTSANSFLSLSLASHFINLLPSLDSFESRIKLCQNNLHQISSGSSRIVFSLSPSLVLKLAKNKKGIAQNKFEASLSHPLINSPILSHPLFLISPLASKCSKKSFQILTSIPFDQFSSLLSSKSPPNIPFLNSIISLQKQFNLAKGDLQKLSSYGIVNSSIKIIDAGLSSNIYDKFYASKSNSS